jgi:RNA polymerase primary sigma factor
MTQLLTREDQTPLVPGGEDDLRQFLQDIRQFPRLSAQQELSLARRCADGDEDAIRQMVNANLRLVVSVAREYAGRGVPMLDLVQEGTIGLLAAARKFDYTLEYRFSTYATKWIRQGIGRCLAEHSQLIRVPSHTQEKIKKIQMARAVLLQETGQEPTVAQLAQCCAMPQDKVEKYLALQPQTCSLDAPVGEDDSIGMLLEDLQASQPHEQLVREELNRTIEQLLSMLTQRQRQVLRLHFGMDDGICHSLEDIGQKLGISKERARQIEKQAMASLKKLGADLGLEDFLE